MCVRDHCTEVVLSSAQTDNALYCSEVVLSSAQTDAAIYCSEVVLNSVQTDAAIWAHLCFRTLEHVKQIFHGRANVDLIFGRPDQTLQQWRKELETVSATRKLFCYLLGTCTLILPTSHPSSFFQ